MFRHGPLPRLFRLVLQPFPAHNPALPPHEPHQCRADDQRHDQQDGIDRHRIPVEDAVRRRIQGRLDEIEHAGQTDDESVDLAEGVEAEDFGRVVGHGGVVERAVEDEKGDVGVRGPEVRQDAEEADGGGDGNEQGEHKGRAGVVEDEADQGNGDDAAEREGDVEDVVDVDGLRVRREQVLVLRTDGGDEVIDARHLDDGEEGDEDEPRRSDLLDSRAPVQSTPDARDVFLALLLRGLPVALFALAAEEGGDFRDDAFAVLAALFADAGYAGFVGDAGIDVGSDVVGGIFSVGDKFAHGLVGSQGHEGELGDADADGNNEVNKEELLGCKCAVGGVVDEAVEEEDGGG